MSNTGLNGWGRGTWGSGPWNSADTITLDSQVITSALGSLTVTAVQNISVTLTGFGSTFSNGTLSVTLSPDVSILGFELTSAVGFINIYQQIDTSQTANYQEIDTSQTANYEEILTA